MERLGDAGYSQTMLTTNYRNHPQILDLFNREIYKGLLDAHDSTSLEDYFLQS
jgi:superfamily I DNA and/or RNA helicase